MLAVLRRSLGARALSSNAAPSAAQAARHTVPPPLPPIVPAQESLVSKIVANHLRRPHRLEAPAADDASGAARSAAQPGEAGAPAKLGKGTKLQSTPAARPPAFEPDTLRLQIGKACKATRQPSHWPLEDFTEMVAEMKTTIGRFAGVPRENVRFRVNLVPLSLDTKECITSPARPNCPPASLIGHYVSEQIEAGKLREIGSKRGVSMLVKEIFAAYGPHTGRRRYVKGVRILISGRLGQERASTAGATEGTLPLSTLDADVDYVSRRAMTRSGIIGIKVWVVNDGVPLAPAAGGGAAVPDTSSQSQTADE